MPFAPNSSEQAAWIDLGVAPMGGGKSVFLNAMNFAFVTQAGLSRLPWLSIVDVGPSSSGLITLLRENLPEGKKHLAAYHRLRMTPQAAALAQGVSGQPVVAAGHAAGCHGSGGRRAGVDRPGYRPCLRGTLGRQSSPALSTQRPARTA